MKYICKKLSIHQSSNQEMFAISLSSCSRYNGNFKFDQSVSAIHDSPPYFWDQWGWPPTETSLVTLAPGLRPERRSAPLARGLSALIKCYQRWVAQILLSIDESFGILVLLNYPLDSRELSQNSCLVWLARENWKTIHGNTGLSTHHHDRSLISSADRRIKICPIF
jgi:hypothetical protein